MDEVPVMTECETIHECKSIHECETKDIRETEQFLSTEDNEDLTLTEDLSLPSPQSPGGSFRWDMKLDNQMVHFGNMNNIITSEPDSRTAEDNINKLETAGNEHSQKNLSGPMQISQEAAGMSGTVQECTGCKKNISDRFMLKALDQYWHEDCLKCSCCDCRLGEVGNTLFTKANLLLCRRDYLRLFGTTGNCSRCEKMIPAFEMVMRAKGNVYHLECFACQQCQHRFCVGDRFYLCDNKILCEYDYEERMVFANMAFTGNYNALTQMKRQAHSISDDLSSGYGSPSPTAV